MTATGLVAFLPQFNFIHASITNDTLITFLATAALPVDPALATTGCRAPVAIASGIGITTDHGGARQDPPG
ncbi:MAG: hypothetical protein R3C44_11470 [Chloroflexota bacterium]